MDNTICEETGGEQIDVATILKALQQQFGRIQLVLTNMEDRMDRYEQRVDGIQRRGFEQPLQNARRHNRQDYEEEFEENDEMDSVASIRRFRRARNERPRFERRGDRIDRNIDNIKMKIPPFQGKNDPDAYIEWERRVELVFDCHNYSEEKKVKLAAVEFTDYAIIWWDQLILSRRRNRERPISTWEEMKAVMKRRFVPSYYYRDLHLKLQSLKQGTKSVEEYHKEMEITLIRADIEEDREATMARFLCGLNREIANVVELQHYLELEDMVSMAIKVERQLKRGRTTRPEVNHSSNWKSRWNTSSKPTDKITKFKDEKVDNKERGNSSSHPQKNRDIKCFRCLGSGHIASQCPNKRAMIMLENGEIETEGEDADSMPSLEDASDIEYAAEGETLVIMRSLNANAKEEEGDKVQRENIFHTRCHVKDRVCSLIIDGGSCVNVASKLLVDKLGFRTIKLRSSNG